MRPILALVPILAVLAACGTPQERCIRRGSADLRTLDRLISDSQSTLNRGYALVEVRVDRRVWVPCGPPPAEGKRPRYCPDIVSDYETRPRAVNLDEERAKLLSMQKRRAEMSRAVPAMVAECRALHPE